MTAHKHGQEELPHVRGQRQKLGGPHARGVAAKRSYTMSGVRGGGPGELLTPPHEATGGSQEELPHDQGAVAAQAQET